MASEFQNYTMFNIWFASERSTRSLTKKFWDGGRLLGPLTRPMQIGEIVMLSLEGYDVICAA